MKKIFALLLSVSLILCGCGELIPARTTAQTQRTGTSPSAAPAPTTEVTTEPTTEATTEPPTEPEPV